MQITPELIDQVFQEKLSLAEALGVSPGIVELFAILGSQHYEQGRYEDAHTMFRAAATLDPKNYLGHAGLGVLALVQDDLDGALEHLGRAYEINSKDAAVCSNLGEANLRKGETREAIRYLREAAALDPDRMNPFANRARGMLEAIQPETAHP